MTIAPPQPSPAPRELTETVRRRAWGENHVKLWWLLGLAMFVIATYYAVSRVYTWSKERQLITQGERVEAKVVNWEPSGIAPKNKIVTPETPVSLVYSYKGETYRVFGVMAGRKEPILTDHLYPLYIAKDEPTRWTARTQPGPLEHELISATLLIPFVIVLVVMALWSRRRVLRTYRDGQATLAEVVGVGHTAIAPRSRTIRCAVHTGTDERVIKVVLPGKRAPRVGESIWLLSLPANPHRPVPAALFE